LQLNKKACAFPAQAFFLCKPVNHEESYSLMMGLIEIIMQAAHASAMHKYGIIERVCYQPAAD
jgi:hypothetical protein